MEFELRVLEVLEQVRGYQSTRTIEENLKHIQYNIFKANELITRTPFGKRAFIAPDFFDKLCTATILSTEVALSMGFDLTLFDIDGSTLRETRSKLLELHPSYLSSALFDCVSDLSLSVLEERREQFPKSYQLLWVILYKTDVPLEHLFTDIFPRNLEKVKSGNLQFA